MARPNSYYAGLGDSNPHSSASSNSFIVPIQPSNSSQSQSHSHSHSLHLGTSSLSLDAGAQPSPSSTRTYRYSTSVEAGDYHHQHLPPTAAAHSASSATAYAQPQAGDQSQQRRVARQPSSTQLQSSSGNTTGAGVSRSMSIGTALGSASSSTPRATSSTRMAYSPNPTNSTTIGDTGSSSYLSHYRASPSSQSQPPQAGLMRRGLSYDGRLSSSASPSALHQQQQLQLGYNNSLLPTSSYSPMTGIQPPLSPSHHHNTAPAPNLQQQQQQQPAPPPQRHSYSPSHYAATATTQQQQQAPPPTASSSFYAHHIPSTSPNPASASASTSTPHPPPMPSTTPSHQPQAQQYYQSQQYFDQTIQRQAAAAQQAAGGQQQLSPNPPPPPPPATSTSPNAALFYPPGTDLRSASNTAPETRSRSHSQQARPSRGLRRVRDVNEVVRKVNQQPVGRRADPGGGFVSPLKALTTHLPQTYHLVNPSFRYETSLNPRRVLTKPSKPSGNDGFDNEDSDYILYVNDVLGGGEGKGRYLILDVLGQGTFGQVVKCQNLLTHEIVAVKVVKNKPAYFQQSMMEVTILELINNQWDPSDEHHMLRLKDTFIHHSHLCLVFELLSNNLYELIKQNSFRGLSTSLVRVFTAQLLDALMVLEEAKIIHCDLKPENILLKSLQSPTIKVIDFGSACHEKQTVYTYIQSRFYRSPEVILSLPYSASIDMWSLGCICVELFLGLPLFPGTSEFNQITRIVEMLGMPPDHMLEKGKQTSHFFDQVSDEYGRRRWRLKSLERYSAEYKTQEQPSKKYFSASTLPEIIKQYPIQRKGLKEQEVDKEMKNRLAFIDFVKGLLNLDPETRWSPQQARLHPFVLGEQLLQPFVPPPLLKSGTKHATSSSSSGMPSSPNPSTSAAVDPKRPYGGLPPAPQRSAPARTYDAKAYSQHLNQQQGYTMQAQQAAQRAAAIPTNPYQLSDGLGGPLQAVGGSSGGSYGGTQQRQGQQQYPSSGASSSFGANPSGYPSNPATNSGATAAIPTNPPAVHHYTATRQRSNTGGTQELPPALQKFGQELGVQGGSGQSVTPVLRREDQWQAWERLTGAGAGGDAGNGVHRRISISRNPHLNLLQEQAENGLNSWNSPMRAKPGSSSHQQPPAAGAAYSSYYPSPIQTAQQQFSVVVDGRQQQQSLPPQQQPPPSGTDLFDVGIAAPPLAYSSGANPARYAPYSAGPGASASSGAAGGGYDLPFDAFDHRDGLGTLYQPLQPFQAGVRSAGGVGGGASMYSQGAGGLFGSGAQGGGGGQQQQGKGKGW